MTFFPDMTGVYGAEWKAGTAGKRVGHCWASPVLLLSISLVLQAHGGQMGKSARAKCLLQVQMAVSVLNLPVFYFLARLYNYGQSLP